MSKYYITPKKLMPYNGLAMHRKSIAELLIKQLAFIAFMVYEPLL